MKLSSKGAEFIARHEGFVSKAYRDPVGIWTIGTGFTNRSRIFSEYWRKLYGRKMRAGDRITPEQNAIILQLAANEEYGAAVNRDIKPEKQHEYDGATSVCFNCGPGAAKWKWAKALARGDVKESARRLKTTAVTARGKRLRGLVRRRREEAALIERGDYGRGSYPVGTTSTKADKTQVELNRDYQGKLSKLGFDPGPADGLYGASTKAAVLAFQIEHQDLINDGLLGRATMAQIDRSIAKRSTPKTAGGAAVAAGTGAVVAAIEFAPDWTIWAIVGAVVVVMAVVGFVILKYRKDP